MTVTLQPENHTSNNVSWKTETILKLKCDNTVEIFLTKNMNGRFACKFQQQGDTLYKSKLLQNIPV